MHAHKYVHMQVSAYFLHHSLHSSEHVSQSPVTLQPVCPCALENVRAHVVTWHELATQDNLHYSCLYHGHSSQCGNEATLANHDLKAMAPALLAESTPATGASRTPLAPLTLMP